MAVKRILIVDDEEVVLDLLVAYFSLYNEKRQRLGEFPIQVAVAKNGQEAWDMICQAQGDFDVVLSDLRMPNIDGPELYRRIRGEYPRIIVKFMSGEDPRKLPKEVREAGCSRKPFPKSSLVTEIYDILT